jgi:hypothetical protein
VTSTDPKTLRSISAARLGASLLLLAVTVSCSDDAPGDTAGDRGAVAVVSSALHHDTSPPLRTLPVPPVRPHTTAPGEDEPVPSGVVAGRDPLVRTALASAAAPPIDVNVEGLGAGMPTGGSYSYPPDPVSAVGQTQVMELVNSSLAVFDKRGALLLGPRPTNTIWSGFGGTCENTNDGDAKVRYDTLANRWVVTQFSYFTAPYGVCVAVSATNDATGSWHRYFFPFKDQTDSPMLSVWSDGYYVSLNGIFPDDNLDVPVCVLDRTSMLSGAAATQQCFSTGARAGEPVAMELDGTAPPPAGAPNIILNVDRATGNQLDAWKLHVDWTTPSKSLLTALPAVPVAAFTPPGFLAPQPGTTNTISAGGNNYRLAYRNFGDHESMVFSDTVATGNITAIRWYELRMSGGSPVLYQQGTFAPGDGVDRFLGSAAMDKQGNIAVGYSVSNATTVYPGLRFTGRLAGDPLGQMTLAEGTIIDGHGSQTGTSRWGDYATMSVDPVDDCTFWFTSQYIGENTSVGWRTRLASFRMPGCGTAVGAGILNGNFETGTLASWTKTGTASVGTPAHGGSYAAIVGSTAPTSGDSALAQSFTAPAAGGTLSFWYAVHCQDTITYDWATATLKDTTAGTTVTVLPKTCTNSGAWLQASSALVANHAYTLTLTSHDDNHAADATYVLYDDVTIATTAPPPALANGGFETGTFAPWTSVGTTSIGATAHGGTHGAVLGKVGAVTTGDSAIAQTFAAPSTGGTLSFWYQMSCNDTVTYDWATATLKDNTSGTSTTPLSKTCRTGTWTPVSAAVVAGHSYTLTLTNHDDGHAGDPTYTLVDDVAIR